MTKTTLGNATEERHLTAFKGWRGHFGPGTRPLAFAAACRRLTVTAADAPADALLAL